MLNIFLCFVPKVFDFFFKCNDKFNKYGINFTNDLDNSHIVLYLFNMGVKQLFVDKNLHLKKKFDHGKEIKNINYFIEKNKKIIIYVREDGATIMNTIDDLIKKHPNNILFVMKDYLLKEEKNYNLVASSHYKYLISQIYPKNKETDVISKFNDLKKYYCYSIPYGNVTKRSFLNSYFKKCDKKTKKYDVFYVKHFREGSWNGIYREKLLDKLKNIQTKNKFKLFTKKCKPDEFYDKLLESKIMISVWGNGESLRDDNFCIKNDVIVLRVNTSHLKDFYNLYEEDNIFHFFNVDFSNLEEKINLILNNYKYYYDLHNKRRNEIIKKYDEDYHILKLSKKINKAYKI